MAKKKAAAPKPFNPKHAPPDKQGVESLVVLPPSRLDCPNLFTPVLVDNDDARDELYDRLEHAERVAVDTETTGLRIDRDQIIGVCLAVPPWDKGFYIPMFNSPEGTHWYQSYREFDRMRAFLKGLLEWDIPKLFHNALFDVPFLRMNLGITVANLMDDTMLKSHVIDAEAEHGLKENAVKRIHPEADWYEIEMKRYNTLVGGSAENPKYWLIPALKVAAYGAGDVVFTGLLNDIFNGILLPDLQRVYNEISMPLTRELMDIRVTGVPLDKEYLNRGHQWFSKHLEIITEEIRVAAKDPELNPGSPPQLNELLFNKLGLAGGRKTKTGYSTDEEEMKRLKGKHPIVDQILEYREVQKLDSTYYLGLLEDMGPDNVFRPDISQIKRTGRLGMSRIHQIPRGPLVRTAFIAPDGYVLVGGDQCVTPTQKVLTSDLRWIPARDVHEGEHLIGFGEKFSPYEETIVEKRKTLMKPVYRITTDRGVIEASDTHGFVRRYFKRKREWVLARDLKVGDPLMFYYEPWDEDTSFDGGFLSGFLEGEGWVSTGHGGSKSGACVGFGQLQGETLDNVLALFEEKGISVRKKSTRTYYSKKKRKKVHLDQFIASPAVRVLGSLRPPRLFTNPQARKCWDGRRIWNKSSPPAVIQKIEFLGEQEVIALQTSTKTLIVEGFLSHNSQLEARVLAHYSRDRELVRIYREGRDVHCATAKYMFNLPCDVSEVEDLFPEKRQEAKTINFALLYLETIGGLARQLNCTFAEAQTKYEAFFRLYKDIPVWAKEEVSIAKRNGYVSMLSGRRRYLPELREFGALPPSPRYPKDRPSCYARSKMQFGGIGLSIEFDLATELTEWTPTKANAMRPVIQHAGKGMCATCPVLWSCYYTAEHKRLKKLLEHEERKALNTKIQGTAADLVGLGIIRTGELINRHDYPAHLIIYVHDEVHYLVPAQSQVDLFAKDFGKAMESVSEFIDVPLKFKPKVGRSWLEVK